LVPVAGAVVVVDPVPFEVCGGSEAGGAVVVVDVDGAPVARLSDAGRL
jgi:hypothetical protein